MWVAFGTAVYSVPLGEGGGRQQLCFDAVAARMATDTERKRNWDKLIRFSCPKSKLLCEAQRARGRDEESCWRSKN